MKKHHNTITKNKDLGKFKQVLEKQGIDSSKVEERMRNRSRSQSLFKIKRKRSASMED